MPRKCRVLSISDNPEDTRMTQIVLGSDPEIELQSLDSGEVAIKQLQGFGRPPNLILLASTYSAAHMSALEILSTLKADERLRVVPVVVLAVLGSPDEIEKFYAHQAACVIGLPINLDGIEGTLALIKKMWLSVARLPYSHTA